MFKNLFCKKEEKVTKIFIELESLNDLYKVIEPPKTTYDKDTIEEGKKIGIDITDPTRYFEIITIGAKYGLNSKGAFKVGDIVQINGQYELNAKLKDRLKYIEDINKSFNEQFIDERTIKKYDVTGEYTFSFKFKKSKIDLSKYKYSKEYDYYFIIKSN